MNFRTFKATFFKLLNFNGCISTVNILSLKFYYFRDAKLQAVFTAIYIEQKYKFV